VPRGKLDPAVYQLALRRIGLPPHACIALEDSAHGVRARLPGRA
jgi:HAD superfamily hydrolase (TIGR01509 family)